MFLRLRPFSVGDRRLYFGERYALANTVCALAPDLTEVPMLAYMVRELILKGGADQAATRTELYRKFVQHIVVEHEPNAPYQNTPGLINKVERALGKLSFDALAQKKPHIQQVPIDVYTGEASVTLHDLIAFGLVNWVLCGGDGALFFTHQSFQEFLAAKHAARRHKEVDQIFNERWNPKWTEVIRFLAGLEGESFLERLLSGADNVIHANLFLAAKCVSEAGAVSASLIDTMTTKLVKLSETNPFRRDAILALGRMGRWASPAGLNTLLARLQDEDPAVRAAAADALGRLGKRVDGEALLALVKRLHDPYSGVSNAAANALERLNDNLDDGALHALIHRLNNGNPYMRICAANALGLLGCHLDAAALAALVALLHDDHWQVVADATQSLARVGDQLDGATLGTLVDQLNADDYVARAFAAKALGELGAQLVDATSLTGPAFTALVKLLDDEAEQVRYSAGRALLRLGKRLDAATLTALLNRLGDPNEDARDFAAGALGQAKDRLGRKSAGFGCSGL